MTDKQVVEYDVTEAKISEMSNLYMALTVSDVDDDAGFAEVELGRKSVKAKRVAVEKQRKVFKADALDYGRRVDKEANRIKGMLEPIETHLTEQGDIIRNEVARVKAKEEAAEKAIAQGRVDSLLKVGVTMDYFDVASMDDDQFNAVHTNARIAHEVEQARIAAEEKAAIEKEIAERAELERQAAINKAETERLEKWEAEQKARESEIRAEQEKIETQKRELLQQKMSSRETALKSAGFFRGGYAGEAIVSRCESFIYGKGIVTWNTITEREDAEFGALLLDLESSLKEHEVQLAFAGKVQADQEAKERAEFEARYAQEAKELAEEEARETAERAAEAEKQAAIEAERQENLRPTKDRLYKYAENIMKKIPPVFEDEAPAAIVRWAVSELKELSDKIKMRADDL